MVPDSTPSTLPPTTTVRTTSSGLDVVTVVNEHGTAEVYLQGAHVTRWEPAGHEPVLWLSSASAFEPGVPIRGGIPICFPWFGARADDPDSPAHGFARRLAWTLVDAFDGEGGTVLRMRLALGEVALPALETFAGLEALYEVSVGSSLRVALTVTNAGESPVRFEEAQHTYLAVRDVHETEVRGLEAVGYVDKTVAAEAGAPPHGPDGVSLVPHGQVDRVYLGTSAPVTVDDGDRTVVVTKESSLDTVVWSPGAEVAARMRDVAGAEWQGMVCVETANVLEHAIVLDPGESHTLGSTYTVSASA